MIRHDASYPDTPRAEDWRESAACGARGVDEELFFASEQTSAGRADVEEAKAICRACPVMEMCAQWAFETRQAYGVWGGVTEGERRRRLKIRVMEGDLEPQRGGRPRAECGTPSAYDRHVKRGEPIDDRCRAAHTRASAEKRERAKRKPTVPECGTRSGYQWHRKNGETACDACRAANTAADRRLRETGTTKVLAR